MAVNAKSVLNRKEKLSQIKRKMIGTYRMISAMFCSFKVADHGVHPVKDLAGLSYKFEVLSFIWEEVNECQRRPENVLPLAV